MTPPATSRRLILALLAAGTLGASRPDQDVGAPVEVQVPLILKVLTFDRNRLGSAAPVVIGVVHQGKNRSSLLVRDEAMAAFRRYAEVLAPRQVRPVPLDLDSDELPALLDRYRPTVLYVAPIRAIRIETVAATARQRGITTSTGVPQYVESGLAVGIGLRGDRPEIVINVAAAKAEGADYGSQLLRLARLVGVDP